MISIYSDAVYNDAETEMWGYWERVKDYFVTSEITIGEQEDIVVGKKYSGYLFPLSYIEQDIPVTGSFIFWTTGNKMFFLTTTMDEKSSGEVQTVLDNMIDSITFH